MSNTGEYYFNNGNVYKGEFNRGKMNGKGTYTWGDGAVYEGEWYNDMRHGRGVMYGIDGSVFSGDWFEDEMLGCGTPMCTTIFDCTTAVTDFVFGKHTNKVFHQLRLKQMRVLTEKQLSKQFDNAVKLWLKIVADRVENDIEEGRRPIRASRSRRSTRRSSRAMDSKNGNDQSPPHHHFHHINNMLMSTTEGCCDGPTKSAEDMEKDLLQFYAYYKQATVGPAEWRPDGYRALSEDAKKKLMKWQDLMEMPRKVAMKKFIADIASMNEEFALSLDAYTAKKAAKFFEREREHKALSSAIQRRTNLYWNTSSREYVDDIEKDETDGYMSNKDGVSSIRSDSASSLPTIVYSLIKDRFISYLKTQSSTPDYQGTRGEELIDWYLSEHAGDIEDLKELGDPKMALKKVLKHMREKEGVVIEANKLSSGTRRYENRIFKLSPSLLENQRPQIFPSLSTMIFGHAESPEEDADQGEEASESDGLGDASVAESNVHEAQRVEEIDLNEVQEAEESDAESADATEVNDAEEDEDGGSEGSQNASENPSLSRQSSKMSKALSSMASFFMGDTNENETSNITNNAGLTTIEEGEEDEEGDEEF